NSCFATSNSTLTKSLTWPGSPTRIISENASRRSSISRRRNTVSRTQSLQRALRGGKYNMDFLGSCNFRYYLAVGTSLMAYTYDAVRCGKGSLGIVQVAQVRIDNNRLTFRRNHFNTQYMFRKP